MQVYLFLRSISSPGCICRCLPKPGGDVLDAGADCLSHSSSAMGSSGARWLLAEMLLFFVPAVVAVVNYAQLLLVDGWRIFAVIALSTVMVLGTTAWVVEKVYRYENAQVKPWLIFS